MKGCCLLGNFETWHLLQRLVLTKQKRFYQSTQGCDRATRTITKELLQELHENFLHLETHFSLSILHKLRCIHES